MMRKKSTLLGVTVYCALTLPSITHADTVVYMGSYYMDPTPEMRTTAISGAHYVSNADGEALYITSKDAGAGFLGNWDDWPLRGISTHQKPRYFKVPVSRSIEDRSTGAPFFEAMSYSESKAVYLDYGEETVKVLQSLRGGHVSPTAITVLPEGEVVVLSEESQRFSPVSFSMVNSPQYLLSYVNVFIKELLDKGDASLGPARQGLKELSLGIHKPRYGHASRILVTGKDLRPVIDRTGTGIDADYPQNHSEGRLKASWRFPDRFNNDKYEWLGSQGITIGEGFQGLDCIGQIEGEGNHSMVVCAAITGGALVQDKMIWKKTGETAHSRLVMFDPQALWVKRQVEATVIAWKNKPERGFTEYPDLVPEQGYDYSGTIRPTIEKYYAFSTIGSTEDTIRERRVTDIALLSKDYALVLEATKMEGSQGSYFINRVVAVKLMSGDQIKDKIEYSEEEMNTKTPMTTEVVLEIGPDFPGSNTEDIKAKTGENPSQKRFESIAVKKNLDGSYILYLIPGNGYRLKDRMYVHTFKIRAIGVE